VKRLIRQQMRMNIIELLNEKKKTLSLIFRDETVIIHQIYSVAKQTDALNFRTTLSNQRQLFHGSKYKNFLGILSR